MLSRETKCWLSPLPCWCPGVAKARGSCATMGTCIWNNPGPTSVWASARVCNRICDCARAACVIPAPPHPALCSQPWALPLLSLQLPSCASASHFQHPLSLLSSLPSLQTPFTLFSVCAHALIWLLVMSLFATLSTITIVPIVLRGTPHCCGTTIYTLDPCCKACSIEQQVHEMILKKEKKGLLSSKLG